MINYLVVLGVGAAVGFLLGNAKSRYLVGGLIVRCGERLQETAGKPRIKQGSAVAHKLVIEE